MTRSIIGIAAAVIIFAAMGIYEMRTAQSDYDGHPHRWFAWYPVRLQGGQPIPTVQVGGRVVWMHTVERFRFFGRWVYREVGDQRELTR